MTYRLTGDADANLYSWKNLKFELLGALPGWVAADEGRVVFVTTPGSTYGMWLGGVASWERPPASSPVAAYTVGIDPNDDFTNAYDALDFAKDQASLNFVAILIRDAQTFSAAPGVASILLSEKTVRFIGMPSASSQRPTLTIDNTVAQVVQIQRGGLQFEHIRVSFIGVMGSATSRVFDMLSPTPIYTWNTELAGEAPGVGSIIGLGADGSVSGENVPVHAFASKFSHKGAGGVVFSHKGPQAASTNIFTLWSYGSEWGQNSTENESTDGTTSQNTFIHLSTFCEVTHASAFNPANRKTCIIYLPSDFLSYILQTAGPSITETFLGTDTKTLGTYVPAAYVPTTAFLYGHLAGIDAALAAGAGPPGAAIVPGLGSYTTLALAAAAADTAGATYPNIMVNASDELAVTTPMPAVNILGARVAAEGRCLGSVTVADQDLLLHGNGKDNCIRNVTSNNTKAVPGGPWPYARGTFDYISLTCMGVRDDNEIIAGDAASPHFASGFTFIGNGAWKLKFHCAEVRRGFNVAGLGVNAVFEIDWQFTKFYVPVDDIPLDPAAPNVINGSEFFMSFIIANAAAPVNVAAQKCFFAFTPIVGANVTLDGTDVFIGNKYYSSVQITSAGIVEGNVGIPTFTTVQIGAMAAVSGMVVFNTTLSRMQYYDGSAWVNMDALPPNVYVAPAGSDPSVILPTLPAGSTLWLGAGTYTCGSQLSTGGLTYHLRGEGIGRTILTWSATLGAHIDVDASDCEISEMSIVFFDAAQTGLWLNVGSDGFRSKNVRLSGAASPTIDVDAPNAYLDRVDAENLVLGTAVVDADANSTGLELVHGQFYGTGDASPVITADGPFSRVESCKIRTEQNNALGLDVGGADAEIVDNEVLADDGLAVGIDVYADGVRVVGNHVHGQNQIHGIRTANDGTRIEGNKLLSDNGGAISAIILNSGDTKKVTDNTIYMEDVLLNVGIDIVGDHTRSIFNNNMVIQSGPAPNATFVNALPMNTTVAVTFSLVTGNNLSAAISGAGFAGSSLVGADNLFA